MKHTSKVRAVFVIGISVCTYSGYEIAGEVTRTETLIQGPRLSTGKDEFFCNEVRQGRIADSETVTIENIGNVDLIVTSIEAGCACLPIEISTPLSIPSGESYETHFRVRTESRVGKYRVPIVLRSNSVNAPVQTISISGNVIPGMTTVPEEVLMDTKSLVDASHRFVVDVHIADEYKGGDLVLAKIPVGISLVSKEVRDDGDLIRFTFELAPGQRVIVIDDKVEFELTMKAISIKTRVPIRVSYFQGCEIAPFPINLGASRVGRLREVSTRVKFSENNANVQINSFGDEIVTSSLLPGREDEFELTVTAKGNARGSLGDAFVLLTWTDAEGATVKVKIPIMGCFY